MSELDQFTINYKIQVNAALQNLAKLNAETTKTNKSFMASEKGAKELGEALANGLSGAIPGLGRLQTGLKAITSELGFMTAGATALTAALANMWRVRTQINEQRVQSRDAGVGAVRLEDWQRRMASGNVSRGMVANAVTGSQSFLRGAYADPSRLGPANRLLGMLGINPAAGGAPISNTDFLTRLATRWHGQNDSTVSAEAQMVGINKDVALKMKEMGAAFGEIGMSLEQMKNYLDVAKNVHKLNDELAVFNEQITQLGEKFAGPVLSSVTTLLKLINDAHLPTTTGGAAASMDHQLGAGEDAGSGIAAALIEDKANREAATKKETQTANETARWEREAQKQKEREAAEENRQKQELAKQEDQSNSDFQGTVGEMTLAINAFGSFVGQFGHSVSEQQVRAAWAGTVGLAGGISTSGHKQLGVGETPGTINFDSNAANAAYKGVADSGQYGSIIKAKAAKYGIPENVLRGIVGAESTFDPNAHSGSSYGLAGINKVNWKAYGLNESNWTDPDKNIDAGAAIYRDMLKKAKGDQTLALRYYNGGFDRSKWGAQNAAYPGRVLGVNNLTGPQAIAMDPNYKGPWKFSGPSGLAAGKGESFESIQLLDIQKTIAARAGVSLSQLQNRGAKFGDVNFAAQNYMSELANSRFAINQGLGAAGLTDIQRGNLMANLKTTDLQILNMSRYMPQILGTTQAGGRENTIGQQAVHVVVDVNSDFLKHVRTEVKQMNGQAYRTLGNSMATGIKY
ncbi:lytic transglycosylase catalytic subunit [Caballeronia calidae]|uniref:Lytic transglycosylase catalytic subunit n=1 Tax=Caballeronia calidae TaxID=1777139 RepID=A0A158DLA8_9BURK|nr:transglycosylase SLT domain-containing protein [Caballeronia calidae]SAK95392.1 lytic transglycosylase catalytic subunit [Caballeronia calidae]